METAVFRKIVEEIGQQRGPILRLIAWGEPLLHPRLVQMTRIARMAAPSTLLTLITNGYHMKPDTALALMQSGMDLVEVSIDAAFPGTYWQRRVSDHPNAFSTVESNVRAMIQQRDLLGLGTRVAVSFILYPRRDSEAEFDAFERRWQGVADAVVKRPAHTFKGALALSLPPPSERPPCRCLWARLNISPWGQMSVCYNDWENSHVLGDLRDPETTISEIWRGAVLTQWRRQQRRGDFRGCCAVCKDYNPLAWQHPYEELVGRVLRGSRDT